MSEETFSFETWGLSKKRKKERKLHLTRKKAFFYTYEYNMNESVGKEHTNIHSKVESMSEM